MRDTLRVRTYVFSKVSTFENFISVKNDHRIKRMHSKSHKSLSKDNKHPLTKTQFNILFGVSGAIVFGVSIGSGIWYLGKKLADENFDIFIREILEDAYIDHPQTKNFIKLLTETRSPSSNVQEPHIISKTTIKAMRSNQSKASSLRKEISNLSRGDDAEKQILLKELESLRKDQEKLIARIPSHFPGARYTLRHGLSLDRDPEPKSWLHYLFTGGRGEVYQKYRSTYTKHFLEGSHTPQQLQDKIKENIYEIAQQEALKEPEFHHSELLQPLLSSENVVEDDVPMKPPTPLHDASNVGVPSRVVRQRNRQRGRLEQGLEEQQVELRRVPLPQVPLHGQRKPEPYTILDRKAQTMYDMMRRKGFENLKYSDVSGFLSREGFVPDTRKGSSHVKWTKGPYTLNIPSSSPVDRNLIKDEFNSIGLVVTRLMK